jgi:hypothetical protein
VEFFIKMHKILALLVIIALAKAESECTLGCDAEYKEGNTDEEGMASCKGNCDFSNDFGSAMDAFDDAMAEFDKTMAALSDLAALINELPAMSASGSITALNQFSVDNSCYCTGPLNYTEVELCGIVCATIESSSNTAIFVSYTAMISEIQTMSTAGAMAKFNQFSDDNGCNCEGHLNSSVNEVCGMVCATIESSSNTAIFVSYTAMISEIQTMSTADAMAKLNQFSDDNDCNCKGLLNYSANEVCGMVCKTVSSSRSSSASVLFSSFTVVLTGLTAALY